MADESQDVEMRSEEDTDLHQEERKMVNLRPAVDYEFAPEEKKIKLDSAAELKPPLRSPWDVDSDSDLDDPDSDLRTDLAPTSPLADGLKEYLDETDFDDRCRYSYIDSAIPYQPIAYSSWKRHPIVDMLYKYLYDSMKEKHLDEVVKEKAVIMSPKRRHCASLKIAKEIVKEYLPCDCCLSESEMLRCLYDLIIEYCKSEELSICKEYEHFLLESRYWMCYRKGDRTEIQSYKEYDHFASFDVTFCRLTDVQQDFEKWIFKLMPEEDNEMVVARKYVERDDRNRKRMLRITTRAEYVTMKLEKAEKWGIISMDKLKSEFEKLKVTNDCAEYRVD